MEKHEKLSLKHLGEELGQIMDIWGRNITIIWSTTLPYRIYPLSFFYFSRHKATHYLILSYSPWSASVQRIPPTPVHQPFVQNKHHALVILVCLFAISAYLLSVEISWNETKWLVRVQPGNQRTCLITAVHGQRLLQRTMLAYQD